MTTLTALHLSERTEILKFLPTFEDYKNFLEHCIASYGFLLPRNHEITPKLFADLIEKYYTMDNSQNKLAVTVWYNIPDDLIKIHRKGNGSIELNIYNQEKLSTLLY